MKMTMMKMTWMMTIILIDKNDDDEDDIDDDHHHGDKCNGQNQITFCFPFPEKVHKPCVTSAFAIRKNAFIFLHLSSFILKYQSIKKARERCDLCICHPY